MVHSACGPYLSATVVKVGLCTPKSNSSKSKGVYPLVYTFTYLQHRCWRHQKKKYKQGGGEGVYTRIKCKRCIQKKLRVYTPWYTARMENLRVFSGRIWGNMRKFPHMRNFWDSRGAWISTYIDIYVYTNMFVCIYLHVSTYIDICRVTKNFAYEEIFRIHGARIGFFSRLSFFLSFLLSEMQMQQ